MSNTNGWFQQIRDSFRGVEQAFADVEGAQLIPAFSSITEEEFAPDSEKIEDDKRNDDDQTWVREAESTLSSTFTRDFRCVDSSYDLTYFVDGSLRTVKALDGAEGNFIFPIVVGQIGAASITRKKQNEPFKKKLETDIRLLIPYSQLSDTLQIQLKNLLDGTLLEDKIEDILYRRDRYGNDHYDNEKDYTELRSRASRRAKDLMADIERDVLENCVDSISDDTELVVLDGTMFRPLKEAGEGMHADKISRVIGVSKSFSIRPLIEIEKYLKRDDCIRRLVNLKEGERTDAIELHIQNDWVVAWYQRIRPRMQVESPLDGIVKVETHFKDYPACSSQDDVRQFEKNCSEVWDDIANTIYLERTPTPFHEQRWHVLLYPIYCCERLLKSSFLSLEVLRGLCSGIEI